MSCYCSLEWFTQKKILAENEKIILYDSTSIKLKYDLSGLFYTITATAWDNNDSVKIKYTLADNIEHPFQNALVLSRPNLRASVAGETKIIGNVFATSTHFIKGSIYGINKSSGYFLNGEIITDSNIREKLFLDSLLNEMKKRNNLQDFSIIDGSFYLNNAFDEFVPRKYVINGDLIISCETPLVKNVSGELVFVVKGKTILSGVFGSNNNLEIYSDSTVTFLQNSSFSNTVVFANKSIEIMDNCSFSNVQFFTEQNMEISKSLFEYPSIVGISVYTSDPKNLKNKLKIESTIMNGTVFLASDVTGMGNNKSKIEIDENSKIHGLVYCENNLDLKGKVNGIVYTYNFYFYKEPTEYYNWLVNVEIDRTKLDKWFLLPMGFRKEHDFEILREERIY